MGICHALNLFFVNLPDSGFIFGIGDPAVSCSPVDGIAFWIGLCALFTFDEDLELELTSFHCVLFFDHSGFVADLCE